MGAGRKEGRAGRPPQVGEERSEGSGEDPAEGCQDWGPASGGTLWNVLPESY